MTCKKSTNKCDSINSKNGGSPITSDTVISPELMSLAEFSKTITHRTSDVPDISFEEFYAAKGYKDDDFVSGVEIAFLIGGVVTERTRHGRGKVNGLARRMDEKRALEKRLKEEYQSKIDSGEIGVRKVSDSIRNRTDDEAYIRVLHKRHIRRALAEGQPVSPQVFLDYPDLKID